MPFQPTAPVDLLAALAAAFSAIGVPWYLLGAQAALIWGRPRLTADVDVTVRLDPEEPETLAQRLEQGPLAHDQALRLAVEIADALDKAHRQGIVHRDLKPGNVMITKAGAKLLDFGLAKPAGSPVSSVKTHLANAPVPAPLTARGTLLGTFQYMAPEQLEGREADVRSDVWAFGCVLHEMLTGKPAFDGTGSPVPIVEGVMTSSIYGWGNFAATAAGGSRLHPGGRAAGPIPARPGGPERPGDTGWRPAFHRFGATVASRRPRGAPHCRRERHALDPGPSSRRHVHPPDVPGQRHRRGVDA